MHRILLILLMGFGLIFGPVACASPETAAMKTLYALDESFAVAQQLELAIFQAHALTDDQVQALKTVDHHIAGELERLTNMALSMKSGQAGSLSQADIDSARSDISLFRNTLGLLKPAGVSAPEQTKEQP